MKIAWYPGHIAKARSLIEKQLKNIDLIIEVIDARCPYSTLSSYIEKLASNKKHLIIVSKIDLVEKKDYQKIKNTLYNFDYILLNNKNNTSKNIIDKKINYLLKSKIDNYKSKNIKNYILKAMVVGMPNVGKSTFINSYYKSKKALTGDKPGITKDLQWIKLNDNIVMLDTPGITLPKFENEKVGTNLAYIGSINDDIIDKYEMVNELLFYLSKYYKKSLYNRYKLNENTEIDINEIIYIIGKNIGAIKKGGEIDIDKTSKIIIDDFRKCKIGKIYLEND